MPFPNTISPVGSLSCLPSRHLRKWGCWGLASLSHPFWFELRRHWELIPFHHQTGTLCMLSWCLGWCHWPLCDLWKKLCVQHNVHASIDQQRCVHWVELKIRRWLISSIVYIYCDCHARKDKKIDLSMGLVRVASSLALAIFANLADSQQELQSNQEIWDWAHLSVYHDKTSTLQCPWEHPVEKIGQFNRVSVPGPRLCALLIYKFSSGVIKIITARL